MKALLLLALCASVSGCAYRSKTVYVTPHDHHRDRVHHHHHGHHGRHHRPDRVVVVGEPREHRHVEPAPLPAPSISVEHAHQPGCGHVNVGGVWIAASASAGPASAAGSLCAGHGVCGRFGH